MADKKGGKQAAGPDDIMSPGEMKPILALARRGNPASCAIGLTKDKEGVILLDKRRKPKQLLAEMKKQAASLGLELETTTLRFGHAVVDTDEDAGLLTFSVNKAAPGAMRPRLLEHVKKAGFVKIEIIVDAGLENEPEEDEQPAPTAAAMQPPPLDQGAVSPAAPASAAPPPPGAAPGQDAATQAKMLTNLVKRMIPVAGADPARAGVLKALATQAQASLKAGDAAGAAAAMERLRQVLDGIGAPAAASPRPAAPHTAAFAKARVAWVATRQKVESDLDKLHAKIIADYKDHGHLADIEKFFRAKVEPVLDSLDDSLARKFDEIASNADPAQHADLVRGAKQIMAKYKSYIAGEPFIAGLDTNPFMPLAIEKTLAATLSTLEKVIA